mmetsp:Transcript_4086/g.13306  ORF Transcript_4086/g.13306 Transcript_4086/m.13306 type:complete len:207 (+) Transcript_4086:1471-2091(+)
MTSAIPMALSALRPSSLSSSSKQIKSTVPSRSSHAHDLSGRGSHAVVQTSSWSLSQSWLRKSMGYGVGGIGVGMRESTHRRSVQRTTPSSPSHSGVVSRHRHPTVPLGHGSTKPGQPRCLGSTAANGTEEGGSRSGASRRIHCASTNAVSLTWAAASFHAANVAAASKDVAAWATRRSTVHSPAALGASVRRPRRQGQRPAACVDS